jgi:PTH1 family peptidyl-tRNA hydrolase
MVLDRVAMELDLLFESYGTLGAVAHGRLEGNAFRLLKPLTFMNRSGRAVGVLMDLDEVPVDKILVVTDDFHLPLGRIRIRRKGSDGGHKGLESIIRTLGCDSFPRLRVGIGPVPADANVVDFVLEDFNASELTTFQVVMARAGEALGLWLRSGDIDLCMNRFNRDPDPGS